MRTLHRYTCQSLEYELLTVKHPILLSTTYKETLERPVFLSNFVKITNIEAKRVLIRNAYSYI